MIGSVAAASVGLSNLLEDAFGFQQLGFVWVAGMPTLAAGMLVVTVSTFRLAYAPRRASFLLLACTGGLLFMEFGGLFVLGVALIALGMLPAYDRRPADHAGRRTE